MTLSSDTKETIIIDTLFGTGLSRPPEGIFAAESTCADAEPVSLAPRCSRQACRHARVTRRIGGHGFGVFVAIMYLVFLSIYTLAAPLMDGIAK